MEAEKAKALQLALNYSVLHESMAFRDLLAWLEDSVESLELKCAQAEPESKEHFQAYFAEWQQRKMVVAGIKMRIRNQIELKTELEEEAINERTGSGDPDIYSGRDSSLPGYN